MSSSTSETASSQTIGVQYQFEKIKESEPSLETYRSPAFSIFLLLLFSLETGAAFRKSPLLPKPCDPADVVCRQDFSIGWNLYISVPIPNVIPNCDLFPSVPSSIIVKIMGFLTRLYCFYGNLLCHNDDHNLFTNDWAFV